MRLGAERQWVEDRGPGLKMAQGSQSQMWAEWGQQVHVMAGWGERSDNGHGEEGSMGSLGRDRDSRGGSGCGVLSHWYRQVLKQPVSAPTSWPPAKVYWHDQCWDRKQAPF